MLLPMEINTILKEKYCKKNTIRFFYFDNNKIVFTLLSEVVIDYMIFITINIRKTYFERSLTLFVTTNLVFILAQMMSCMFSFV